MHIAGHIVIQRSDDMVSQLHDGYSHTSILEVLSHFHADIAASYNHSALRELLFHILTDLDGIGNIAQSEYTGIVCAFHGRTDGSSTRRKNELVIAFGVLTAVLAADCDSLGLGINGGHFAVDPDIHIEPGIEALGSLEGQSRLLGDFTTDIIGQTTVGKRDVLAAFKHNDLSGFIQTAQSCCCGSTAGYTAYNYNFHGKASFLLKPFVDIISITHTGLLCKTGIDRNPYFFPGFAGKAAAGPSQDGPAVCFFVIYARLFMPECRNAAGCAAVL